MPSCCILVSRKHLLPVAFLSLSVQSDSRGKVLIIANFILFVIRQRKSHYRQREGDHHSKKPQGNLLAVIYTASLPSLQREAVES